MAEREFLTTTPGTQISFTVRMWCAGHGWRNRRGLGWLHRIGHRARLLRDQPPALPLRYIGDRHG